MKAQSDVLQVHAFVDGELDLASQLAMEQRLQQEGDLRAMVEEARQLRESVKQSADYHAAPAALRARLTALLAPQEQPTATPRRWSASESVNRWLGWRPLVAGTGFAAVLAVAVNMAWLQSSDEQRMAQEVVASHVRSTLGEHLVDVASSDHHTVKPFLSTRLGFSPPVSGLQIPGSVFVGGRVDYLDGRPVAALVYRQGQHIVNSYVWPATASDSSPRYTSERGYQTAHWVHKRMTHWVISDVNREEFGLVVGAVQAADADRQSAVVVSGAGPRQRPDGQGVRQLLPTLPPCSYGRARAFVHTWLTSIFESPS